LGPWTPYTIFSHLAPIDDFTVLLPHFDDLPLSEEKSNAPHIDEDLPSTQGLLNAPSSEEGVPDDDPTSHESLTASDLDDEPTPPLLHCSQHISRPTREAAYAYAISTALHINDADVSAVVKVFNERRLLQNLV
jgi:hypothetical protein